MSSSISSNDRGEMFWANMRAHLIYFRRSRLILGFAVVLLVLAVLFSLPALFVRTQIEGFGLLQEVFRVMNGFLIFFSAALGLIIISSHLRARNLKMVFTKPCPPALWMASALAATITMTAILDAVILAIALVLSAVYRMPIQGGLIFIALDTLIASIGMVAYLMFLAMIMHPVFATAFAIILGPWTFRSLEMWSAAGLMAGKESAFVHVLRSIFHFCYMALPMVHAYGEKTVRIYSSLRVGTGGWRYLPYSLGYAIALAALCYCLALLFLQRKQLN